MMFHLVLRRILFLTLAAVMANSISSGQEAYFQADSTELFSRSGNRRERYTHILEMEWVVNGQFLTWGTGPIGIIPDEDRIDTLLYRNYSGADYDTICRQTCLELKSELLEALS